MIDNKHTSKSLEIMQEWLSKLRDENERLNKHLALKKDQLQQASKTIELLTKTIVDNADLRGELANLLSQSYEIITSLAVPKASFCVKVEEVLAKVSKS